MTTREPRIASTEQPSSARKPYRVLATAGVVLAALGSAATISDAAAHVNRFTAVSAAAGDQITRLSLTRTLVNGTRGRQQVRGGVLIRTPSADWRRSSRDASRSARFNVRVNATCQGSALVTNRAVATSAGALSQARRATNIAITELSERSRSRGALRLVEIAPRDDQRQLYGIAVVKLAPSRYLHVGSFLMLDRSCTDDALRNEMAPTVSRLLRTARVQARVTQR